MEDGRKLRDKSASMVMFMAWRVFVASLKERQNEA